MRRALIVTGVATLITAVAMAGIAIARNTEFFGSSNNPRIDFTAVTKHGKIRQLRQFTWDGVPCQGGLPNSSGFNDRIRVRHDRFKHAENLNIESGVHVRVRGRFNPQETQARGIIVAKGACNSGKQHWTAKAMR